jgi:asparagine synthase (glutamine-hydrolysing)
MEHVVIRPEGMSPLDLLGRDASLSQEPIGHPCNFVWWAKANDEAKARGLRVMLTGEAGNLTMSAGGLATLAQFVRAGRFATWFREARMVAGNGPTWRGVLATSFGPWMPHTIWRGLLRLFGPPPRADSASLVHPRFRLQMKARAAEAAREPRLERDDRKLRWNMLQRHEPGNFRKGALARWGIDERDPTADRRLAEFCLAVPPEQLFAGGVSRRLARIAFSDRLPETVLSAPRGYQYPDWYEQIDEEKLERTIAQLETGPAASVLDMAGLRQLASTWPTGDWHLLHIIGTYRLGLLMALSAGAFANQARQSGVQAGDGMELAGLDAAR